MMMPARHILLTVALLLVPVAAATGQSDPFQVDARASVDPAGRTLVTVSFGVPDHHYLYADMMEVSVVQPEGARLDPVEDTPAPHEKEDPFSGEMRLVFDEDVRSVFAADATADAGELVLEVSYQGCNEDLCFFPTTRQLKVALPGSNEHMATRDAEGSQDQPPGQTAGASSAESLLSRLEDFTVRGTAAGYLPPDDFLQFLEAAESGEAERTGSSGLAARLEEAGLWLSLLLILVGGLALNLTPCVLPMIPINLAIIGAGSQAGSRARGFLLGGLYGAGIAFTYGLLGLVVLFTGSTFGTLNASPVFNFAVAIVFVVLALAMFDLFHMDFSRFRPQPGKGAGGRLGLLAIFSMGALAALLAGACVAPVVIAVLVLAGQQWAAGQPVALALPFVLGLGMALPWPIAGAGLSLLPRPGGWMTWVRNAFGVFILLMGLYYGWLGVTLLGSRPSEAPADAGSSAAAMGGDEARDAGWMTRLGDALDVAEQERKLLFIDFWATWCKNCLRMENTFEDEKVRQQLDSYVKVKFQAEKPGDSPAKEVLGHFNAQGLPTYVVLEPPGYPAADSEAPRTGGP